MTDFAGGKIEAYFGPTERNAPDDLETVICEFIAGAKRSLDIAVQEIDSMKTAEAILDARWPRCANPDLPRTGLPEEGATRTLPSCVT